MTSTPTCDDTAEAAMTCDGVVEAARCTLTTRPAPQAPKLTFGDTRRPGATVTVSRRWGCDMRHTRL